MPQLRPPDFPSNISGDPLTCGRIGQREALALDQ
jgi:hypothetical protein